MEKRIIIVLVIMLVIVSSVFATYVITNKQGEKGTIVEENKISERDNNILDEKANKIIISTRKDLHDVPIETYSGENEKFSVEDIKVPYIDAKSEYAKKANEEIKGIYTELIEEFNNNAELYNNEDYAFPSYGIADYEVYKGEETLSVVLTVEKGGTDVPKYTYYTYNFDLNTLEKVDYSTMYSIAGFTENNIQEKVEKAIRNNEKMQIEFIEESNIQESIKDYNDSLSNNELKYFLDYNNKLNVIVSLNIPAGREYFPTIITIE